ncbi:MAG: AmmeMemoRadiSam system radical SAM enzyme [Acidobacteriota bacterium]
MFYEKRSDRRVMCNLCAHRCAVAPGNRGICGVRENQDGTLVSLVYEKAVACSVDPIEKKPFFHFMPGTRALSIATAGCNFRCLFCQNHHISDLEASGGRIEGRSLPCDEVVRLAAAQGCASISYTYTEPTIFFEYAADCALLAREQGIRNSFVTNGYMAEEGWRAAAAWLDAANVDLKSMTDDFYRKYTGARLRPVLDSLRLARSLGIWIEVTTLLIPGLNDSDEELGNVAAFLAELGLEVPWHVSRFHPAHKLLQVDPTPTETLGRARKIGLESGLRYVYIGNVPGEDGENTYCPGCGKVVVGRVGYQTTRVGLEGSRCASCGAGIDGVGLESLASGGRKGGEMRC